MRDQEQSEKRMRLARLQIEHNDYSNAIEALIKDSADALCIQRFKKKKLALKDEINKLHIDTTPNIIA
ncbi:MAG: YdcH family protein [Nitratireductor sp.]